MDRSFIDQAAALIELGYAEWQSGRLQAAQTAFEQLLAIALSRKNESLAATAWNNLAVVFRERGEFAMASICQQRSLRITVSRLADDSSFELLSQNLSNLANDAILAGDYRSAERLLISALDLDARNASAADEAADWGGLGIVYLLTGRVARARHAFFSACDIHERLGDDRGLGCDLGHLGQISMADEDWQAARSFFERSMRHFERAGCAQEVEQTRRTLRELAGRQRVAGFCPVRN